MKINDDFIRETIDGKCAVIPVGETSKSLNGIFMLNETGEKILDLVEDGKNADEIIDAFSKEYASGRAEIAEYVNEFLDKLRGAGILEDE